MSLFAKIFGRPGLKELAESGDMSRLWTVVSKGKGYWGPLSVLSERLAPEVSNEKFIQVLNSLWDQAVHENVKGSKSAAILNFADELCKSKRFYTGDGPLTPADFLATSGTSQHGEKRSRKTGLCTVYEEGFCPICGQTLTEQKPGVAMSSEELGMYRVCASCDRHYHRKCAAGIHLCEICSGTQWKWSLRSAR